MPRKVFPLIAKPLFKIIFSCIPGNFKLSFPDLSLPYRRISLPVSADL